MTSAGGHARLVHLDALRGLAASSPSLSRAGLDDRGAWPLLSVRLSQQTGRPVVVILEAHAGSPIHEWAEGQPWFAQRATEVLRQAIVEGIIPDVAIWIQGERDAELGTTTEH